MWRNLHQEKQILVGTPTLNMQDNGSNEVTIPLFNGNYDLGIMKRKDLGEEQTIDEESCCRSNKQVKLEDKANISSNEDQKQNNDNPACIPISPALTKTDATDSANPTPPQNSYKLLSQNLHNLFSPQMGTVTVTAPTDIAELKQGENNVQNDQSLNEQASYLKHENHAGKIQDVCSAGRSEENEGKNIDDPSDNNTSQKPEENKVEETDGQQELDEKVNKESEASDQDGKAADCSNANVETKDDGNLDDQKEQIQKTKLKQEDKIRGEKNQESKPTAKEEAAAKAARIRLGIEQPSAEDLKKMAQQQAKLPKGDEPAINVDFQYISADKLSPLEDPRQISKDIEKLLTTTDWQKMCDHINFLRSLALFNKELLTPQLLSQIVPKLIKYINNPRSSVCKTALICAKDLIVNLNDSFEPYMDMGGCKQPNNSLLATLLLKASANDKKFVIEATQEALDSAATQIVPHKVLVLILPYTLHKNAKVRGQASIFFHKSLARMSSEDIFRFGLEKFLKSCGNLICDKTPEARDNARQCIYMLRNVYESPEYKQLAKKEGNQSSADINGNDQGDNHEEEDQKENSPAKSNLRSQQNKSSEKQDSGDKKEADSMDWSQFCIEHVCSSVVQQVLKVG